MGKKPSARALRRKRRAQKRRLVALGGLLLLCLGGLMIWRGSTRVDLSSPAPTPTVSVAPTTAPTAAPTPRPTATILANTPKATDAPRVLGVAMEVTPAPVALDLPYAIVINETAQIVTVYTVDENGDYRLPVKHMICSTSKFSNLTYGHYRLTKRYEWLELIDNKHYGHYCLRFAPNFLFHSVPYVGQNPAKINGNYYNKLGKRDSVGCIRLLVKDAKWLYDHCPKNTLVTFKEGKLTDELRALKATLVPPALQSRWDPTDPDPNNPDYIAEPDATPEPTPVTGVTPRPTKLRIRSRGHD